MRSNRGRIRFSVSAARHFGRSGGGCSLRSGDGWLHRTLRYWATPKIVGRESRRIGNVSHDDLSGDA